MKKSELKNGAVVELRNGDKCIKIDNTLLVVHRQYKNCIFGWLNIKEYQDDLIYWRIKDFDIMKVNNEVMNEYGGCFKAINKTFNLSISKWEWVREEKPKRILTPKEYNYLKAVIAPVRDKVKWIIKTAFLLKKEGDREKKLYACIIVKIGNYSDIFLYTFEADTEYKGMELDKEYSLEELGL